MSKLATESAWVGKWRGEEGGAENARDGLTRHRTDPLTRGSVYVVVRYLMLVPLIYQSIHFLQCTLDNKDQTSRNLISM